jgi:tRNA(fMet)-specific endonuclease VapC
MIEAMLDANVCIRVLRHRPTGAKQRFATEANRLAMSTIVFHELLYGAARSQHPLDERRKVEAFASRLNLVEFDARAAFHAADIKADLARRGLLIGPNDLLIAGHARSRGFKLITNNLREFERVDGLRCEDWL